MIPLALLALAAMSGAAGGAAGAIVESRLKRQQLGADGGPLVITSPYGMRHHPADAEPRMHRGVDLRMPIGTPLRAVTDARVVKVWGESTPNQLDTGNGVLLERDGWRFAYMHLSAVFVRPGQFVRAGELLGLSGASGKRVTGPHLHFAIRTPSGASVDPETIYPPGSFAHV